MKYTVLWNWPDTTSLLPNEDTVEAPNIEEAVKALKVKLAAELPRCPVSKVVIGEVIRLDELKITSEARDRIRAAIVNSFSVEQWPQEEITAYLPACLPERSCADLAIAIGVLAASGAIPPAALAGVVFLAELGLDGALRPVPDVAATITAAAEGGLDTVVVAAGDAAEAAVPGLRVLPAQTLAEVIEWLRAGRPRRTRCSTIGCLNEATHTLSYSFPESRDQTETDIVCAECGDGYLRRPILLAELEES
jgi:Subunit ChlI of Mg-chelatase